LTENHWKQKAREEVELQTSQKAVTVDQVAKTAKTKVMEMAITLSLRA